MFTNSFFWPHNFGKKINSSNLPMPITYLPSHFVARAGEIALVEKRARKIIGGDSDQPRTIIFRSQRGSGKTWFSLHLTRTILPGVAGALPLLISLLPKPDGLNNKENEWFPPAIPSSGKEEEFVTTVVKWVAPKVGATTAPEAPLRQLTDWLARDIGEEFKDRLLILVLDSVLEMDWSLLEKLEQYLLAPLATLPCVLIMITGRGPYYPWESPYLRVEEEKDSLKPFGIEDIKAQLKLQAPGAEEHAEEIKALSGGHPLSNVLIAQTINNGQAEALNEVAEALLSVVQPAEKRKKMREYFEALCVLDGFREEEISPMLAAYYGDPEYEAWSIKEVREKVRGKLLETHLMHWETRYTIDESLRCILENFLKAKQPERWHRLRCRAYRLYLQWAEDFPKWQEYFTGRADRHQAVLTEEGFNPDECL